MMDRRAFLKLAGAGGVSLALPGSVFGASKPDVDPKWKPFIERADSPLRREVAIALARRCDASDLDVRIVDTPVFAYETSRGKVAGCVGTYRLPLYSDVPDDVAHFCFRLLEGESSPCAHFLFDPPRPAFLSKRAAPGWLFRFCRRAQEY